MKKTIGKKFVCFMMIASLILVMASCNKEQNRGINSDDNMDLNSILINQNGTPTLSLCSAIPDSLQVPEGNQLVLQTFAVGVQIYEVKRSASNPSVFSWVNIAPFAHLYKQPNFKNEVIVHFAGPSWQFIKGAEKGETVVASKVRGVTKDATSVQWLLLKAVDSLSTHDNKITFVQRICTAGGLAPTTVADEAHLGQAG
jgi:hypothetical protein